VASAFAGLVLAFALAAAWLIRLVPMPHFISFLVWGATPILAALVMLFVLSRDGLTRDGLRSLGLQRLGVRVWWIAFGVSLLVSVLATSAVVHLGFASIVALTNPFDTALNFVASVAIVTVTFAAAEEIAFRGYLLPRLLPLGRNRALAITGLVHAAWHLPLILLTPLYHANGNLRIILPLFVATIVAAGFVFGDLRIATGSIWPASLAHAVHNVAWETLSPVHHRLVTDAGRGVPGRGHRGVHPPVHECRRRVAAVLAGPASRTEITKCRSRPVNRVRAPSSPHGRRLRFSDFTP
jgi:membrane protease YdiL (CAAX protease family)